MPQLFFCGLSEYSLALEYAEVVKFLVLSLAAIRRCVIRALIPLPALWSAVFLFVCAIGITLLIWHSTYRDETVGAGQKFENANLVLIERLTARLQVYDQVLRSTNALHLLERQAITQSAWRSFFSQIEIDKYYPGFLAIAYAPKVLAADRPSLQADSRPSFRSESTLTSSSVAQRSSLFPLRFIMPETPDNLAMLGFDLGNFPSIDATLQQARILDDSRLSSHLDLTLAMQAGQAQTDHPSASAAKMKGDSPQSGFMLVHPIFASDNHAKSLQTGESVLKGYVMALFEMKRFMSAVIDADTRERVALRVYDASGQFGGGSLMYDSAANLVRENSMFHEARELKFASHTWQVVFDSSPTFDASVDHSRSFELLIFGIVNSLLFSMLAWSIFSSREIALRQARNMTKELRSSEERFRMVSLAMEDGIWDRDLTTGVLYISPQLEAMLGHSFGDASRTREQAKKFWHPEDYPKWQQALEEHYRTRKPFLIEYRLRHVSGEFRWFRSSCHSVWDKQGKLIRMVGALRDISEEKQALERLKRQSDFFAQVLDVIPDPLTVKDDESHYIFVNRACAEACGRTREEMMGLAVEGAYSKISHRLHRREAEQILRMDQQILLNGGDMSLEMSMPDVRFGTLRDMIIKKALARDPDGKPLVVSIQTDITDLKVALRRFELLTKISSDWFWELDSDLNFTQMELMDGSHTIDTAALGRHPWDMSTLISSEAWAQHRMQLEAHQPFRNFVYTMSKIENFDDPDTEWFLSSGEPLFDREHQFLGYQGVCKNITALYRAEVELRRHRDHLQELVAEQTIDLTHARDLAERANRAKSEFLSNMSHELRTPMHAILSFSRLGSGRISSAPLEKLETYFARIEQSGERLLNLLNELLDLSKLEAGKMLFDFKLHDLGVIVREVLPEFESLLQAKSISLTCTAIAEDLHASVDGLRLGQVVRNLLSNAIKFVSVGGAIEIILDDTDISGSVGQRIPAVRLRVNDNGVGIPETELEAIFDKFVQSTQTKNGAGGTGLGLAISKEIIEAHGGTIRAYNLTSGGSCFEILLPRA